MTKKKIVQKVFSDSIVYGFSRYLSLFAAIFLTPIFTRILTKADYGIMDIYNSWNALMIAVLPLGLLNAIIRFYPEVKDQTEKKNELLQGITSLFVLISGIYVLALLLFTPLLNSLLEIHSYPELYYYSIGIVVLTIFFNYNLEILRAKFKKIVYGGLSLLNFVILSALGFILVFYYKTGVKGFFIASLVSLIVSNIVAFYFNPKLLQVTIKFTHFKKLLEYSIHFVSVIFLFQATEILDRYLIKEYLSIEDVGVYSIAVRISGVLKIVLSSFGMAWMPYVFAMNRETAKNLIPLFFNLFIFGSLFLIIVISCFRTELILFFAPDYQDAFHLIPLLLILNFILAFVYVFTLGIQISKKTKAITYAAILSIIANVCFSVWFVQYMGMYGIVWGSIIGSLLWVGVQHFYSQKLFKITYQYSLLVISLLVGLALTFLTSVNWPLFTQFSFIHLVIKSVAVLLLLAVLVVGFFKVYLPKLKQQKLTQ
ncbi:MAG: lipopolysaccharide biosynthesis protein [Flammeovirgaceae bacterium]